MKDGEVVEDPEDEVETVEDDVETGTKTCCGCFSTVVPDTEGTAKGEQTEMIEIVPDFNGEEGLNSEGGELTEAPEDDLDIRTDERHLTLLETNHIFSIVVVSSY